MKIRFDHLYCADQDYAFRRKLGRSGFFLSDRMVEHPGKHFCRFLYFPQPLSERFQYLEFIHTGKGGKGIKSPGFSLGTLSSLKVFNEKLKKKGIKTEFDHKNYEWKKNNTDVLPGWNFVSFKRKSDVYTWLTEYEPSPKRKPLPKKVNHPNKVHKIVAFDFLLSRADLNFFIKLFGRPKDQVFELVNGVQIHYKNAKKSSVKNVILATKDLNRLVKKYPWDSLTSWNNRPGVLLQSDDPKMWDVIVIQD